MKGNTLLWFQLIMIMMMMTFTLSFLFSFLPLLLSLILSPTTLSPAFPPAPSPIPNYSKKEKAWGRAHLPQMSDECVATRDPHSSPPSSALTVYRHPQSLTGDLPSHRFRFRYSRFGAILWTFFYFTDVFLFFLMSGIEWLKKIEESEAFSACKQWVCCGFLRSSSDISWRRCRRWPSEW